MARVIAPAACIVPFVVKFFAVVMLMLPLLESSADVWLVPAFIVMFEAAVMGDVVVRIPLVLTLNVPSVVMLCEAPPSEILPDAIVPGVKEAPLVILPFRI